MKRFRQHLGWWLVMPVLIGGSAGAIYSDTRSNPPATSKITKQTESVLKDSENVKKVEPPKPEEPKPVAPKPSVRTAPVPVAVSGSNLVNLLNQVRARAGVAPVQEAGNLNGSALRSARDLSSSGRCNSGDTCTHGNWQQWFAGLGYTYTGENILACAKTDAEAIQIWVDSPTHYANMIGRQFRYAGFGIVTGEFHGDFSGGQSIRCKYYVSHFGG